MKNKRKVAVFTGSRAEYGLILPILKKLIVHPMLTSDLIVAGSHLDDGFGKTLNEIESDGIKVSETIQIDMSKSSLHSTALAISSCIREMVNILVKLEPDFLVVYADRFEGFAAVIAATQMNVATVHIEGGDITEGGALDDSVRHAMSKLSHLHFTTNSEAANRLLSMGEEPWRVFNVGLPAMDLIKAGEYATGDEIVRRLGIKLDQPVVLFTQHSVTTQYMEAGAQIRPSLDALKVLSSEGVQVVITYPNNDAGSADIIEQIVALKKKNLKNIIVQKSLGRHFYHGILGLAKTENTKVVCVGNSSSGLKETGIFGCPAVNIGSRQDGRLRGTNVVDADYDKMEILAKVRTSLFDADFREKLTDCSNPYGEGGVGEKIADTLSNITLSQKLICKRMMIRGERENGWFR